ncbi:BspA family leucine-rich repeat surface protein [Chryseobacterium paridis]|uniref:BspA family leucine-rich repeat surface protein n=1 Tax=Chryseobacterium paridis TaxID=2800328 RepID=A0ABS1FYB2_9FLAO|nr:BspA family leucine-rich repeat surface protein [Chryseobacterium paridis]MBK1897446.1 BspA family leucine-rich repeat surface protein [Chryseobacterium paridis]
MHRKFLSFILAIFFFQSALAQDEFITIWKPNVPAITPPIDLIAPNLAGNNQIWFPGIGENYTINWEEVGYPQHNGTMPNVTSTSQVFIDFGTSLNPDQANATYKVKVTNGNGTFKQIRFGDPEILNVPSPYLVIFWHCRGSIDKITEISQWGNINWTSMNNAFSNCRNLQVTATDSPKLSNVEDASFMFYGNSAFNGNLSMTAWNTSHIKKFTYMFGHVSNSASAAVDNFNLPIGSWDMSSAEDISYMFFHRRSFNQNINNWNTSKVTTMAHTFENCYTFNQPLDNWNTSKVTNMTYLFHFIPEFNQPIGNWDTSNVTNFSHMFHNCIAFNQPLDNWDTSKGTTMEMLFTGASSFNQPLGNWNTSLVGTMLFTFLDAISFDQSLENWNLSSLTIGDQMIKNSGLKCENYSKTISGWANNPSTPNNINLVSTAPLVYSPDVVNERNILISKGWIFNGDTLGGECRLLGVSENQFNNLSIYPNPAKDFIYIKNIKAPGSYKVVDMSGRILIQNLLNNEEVDISSLTKGNYILQITSKDKIQSLKFIKK